MFKIPGVEEFLLLKSLSKQPKKKKKEPKPIRPSPIDEQKRDFKRDLLREIDESEAEYKKDEDSVDSLKKVLAEFESKCSMNQTLYMWLVDYARSNINTITFKWILEVLKCYPSVRLNEKANDPAKKNIHDHYQTAATAAELKVLRRNDDENQEAKVEEPEIYPLERTASKLDDDEMNEENVRLFEILGIVGDRNTCILREKLKDVLASKGYGFREYHRLCLILKAFGISLELCSWDAKYVNEPTKQSTTRLVDRAPRAKSEPKPDKILQQMKKHPSLLGGVTIAESGYKPMKKDSKSEAFRNELKEALNKYEKHDSHDRSDSIPVLPQSAWSVDDDDEDNVTIDIGSFASANPLVRTKSYKNLSELNVEGHEPNPLIDLTESSFYNLSDAWDIYQEPGNRPSTSTYEMWQLPEEATATEENYGILDFFTPLDNIVPVPTMYDDFGCIDVPIDLSTKKHNGVQEEPQPPEDLPQPIKRPSFVPDVPCQVMPSKRNGFVSMKQRLMNGGRGKRKFNTVEDQEEPLAKKMRINFF